MTQAHQALVDEISMLPIEKLGKALSFIRFLEQEPETELLLDSVEENEIRNVLASGEFIESSELLAKIKELPND